MMRVKKKGLNTTIREISEREEERRKEKES